MPTILKLCISSNYAHRPLLKRDIGWVGLFKECVFGTKFYTLFSRILNFLECRPPVVRHHNLSKISLSKQKNSIWQQLTAFCRVVKESIFSFRNFLTFKYNETLYYYWRKKKNTIPHTKYHCYRIHITTLRTLTSFHFIYLWNLILKYIIQWSPRF